MSMVFEKMFKNEQPTTRITQLKVSLPKFKPTYFKYKQLTIKHNRHINWQLIVLVVLWVIFHMSKSSKIQNPTTKVQKYK